MSEQFESVAHRILRCGDATVCVRIAKPVEDRGDYRCDYVLDFAGEQLSRSVFGMDSVQALQLALKKIAVDLISVSKRLNAPISWLEDAPGVTGFP